MDISALKIRDLRRMLDERELSATELTSAYFERIRSKGKELDCFITLNEENALLQAKIAQAAIDSKNANSLTGIPYGAKDNLCTEGIRTTCGSKMLEDFMPAYSSDAIERLNETGSVMLGKTSMDEFAMGDTTKTCVFTDTRNPYDINHVPGGSSGGSAVAVSARLAPFALGTDTGGSIRQPAAFCGVTGIKPTYGRVSRHGMVAYASSFDQVGAIAQDAHDCALVLNAIAGHDFRDVTTAKTPTEDFTSKIGQPIKGMKIGLPAEFFSSEINSEVKSAVLAAAKKYEDMGAQLVECSLPSLKYAVMAFYIIASADASSNLARFDGIKFGYRSKNAESYEDLVRNSRNEAFGEEVKHRILLGNYALSQENYDSYFLKAHGLKQQLKREYRSIFEACDAVLTPTTPTTAHGINDSIINDPVAMYKSDFCTVSANLCSLPAISSTCGYDKNGMPIGFSLVGNRFTEATLIQLCDSFERDFNLVLPKNI